MQRNEDWVEWRPKDGPSSRVNPSPTAGAADAKTVKGSGDN
jgi:hypothetical protein